MPINPYQQAFVRMAQRRGQGRAWIGQNVVAAVGGVAACSLLQDSIFGWHGAPNGVYFPAAVAALARLGVLVAGVATLAAFDQLIRDPLRGIVDLHPVLARAWVRAQFRQLAPRLVPALVATLPLLYWYSRDVRLLLGSALVLVGATLAGAGAGAGIALAAPAIGGNPRFFDFLDAIRGPNPRPQAALIWAPAVALAIAGSSVVIAAFGLGFAVEGNLIGAFAVGVPVAVGAGGFILSHRDARVLAAVPAILGEVQAAYAAADAPDEERRVYGEGIAERLRDPLRREVVRVLRHGWRGHRGWLSLSWVGGLFIAAAGWSDDPAAAITTVAVGGAVVAGIAALGPRLRALDPPWLELSLPGRPVVGAHVVAMVIWLQGPLVLGVLALAVRQGSAAIMPFLQLQGLVLLLAALGARLPMSGYVPAAVLGWAVVVAT